MGEGYVTVQFVSSAGEFNPGDQVEVTIEEAKRLVNGRTANYATVPEAKKAGGDPADAATKK